MKGLLDTHVFIWWDSEPSKLSPNVTAFLNDPKNVVMVSVVSVWELLIKTQLGKVGLTLPVKTIVTQQAANGVHILPVTLDHVLAVESLPPVHKDPFDRLLAAQAMVEGATLLTADPIFGKYPVNILW